MTTLIKEQLLSCLNVDDIQVPETLLKKIQDDDAIAFCACGILYNEKEEYDRALDWFSLGASKGHVDSQFKLGYMHAVGKGVTVDYKLSVEWYLKAYNNGHTGAANNVGYFYLNGKGVNRDFKLALQWFLEGADSGDDFAQYNIGSIYEDGDGVKVDRQFALEWYEKSVQQGNELAEAKVKCLNDQGIYLNDSQKRHLQTEKDLEAQKSEIESLENQLKASEQKRLASDKENRLLKQENEVLKLKSHMDTKDQTAIKENIIQQLAEVSSKIVSLRVSSNVVKGSKADENNPENDICYDK